MGNRHKHRTKRGSGTARPGHGSPPAPTTESDVGVARAKGTTPPQSTSSSSANASAGVAPASRIPPVRGMRRGEAQPAGPSGARESAKTERSGANGASGAARGGPVQRNLPNPGIRGTEGRSVGVRGKVGQVPAGPGVRTESRTESRAQWRQQSRTEARAETRRAEAPGPRREAAAQARSAAPVAESPTPSATVAGRNGWQSVAPAAAPGPVEGSSYNPAQMPGPGAAGGPPGPAGRSATIYAPRLRTSPGEALAPEGEDEDDADLGLPPGVLVPPIPAREHNERERLAMRPEIRGQWGSLIDELRTVFEADRTTAMQAASARCGICYLHCRLDELEYREAEGYYVCQRCSQALHGKRLPMIRRQQH